MNRIEENQELQELVYKVFHNTEDGVKLLSMLKNVYLVNTKNRELDKPEWWPDFREGQNDLVRYFMKCIDVVKNNLKSNRGNKHV